MVMRGRLRILQDETGYTLVETLVAMVLFLSVLIPLGFGITTYVFDRKAEDLERALLLAEERISRQDYQESSEVKDSRFLVRCETNRVGNLLEMRVSVAEVKQPNKVLLILSKMLQAPP